MWLPALLFISGCGLHYSRTDHRYPSTAGPVDLRLSMSLPKEQVGAGEPFFVTLAMHNTADSACTWGPVAPAAFQLVGVAGDTWDYKPRDYAVDCWSVGGPPPFFGVRTCDSVYWHSVLWPQRFFRRRDTSVLGAGSYRLIGRVDQLWVGKDRKWARMPFTPSESIPVTIASNSSPTWLEPYRGLLDRWFDGRRTGGDWDRKKAAGETLLTIMKTLPAEVDSSVLTLGYQLADIARFAGHWDEVLAICESILSRHPPGMLTEDLGAELPDFYQMTRRRQIADSLVRVFVSRYPQNAAALSHDEGRWLWYDRTPVPPTWHRYRRPFLGLPGPWSKWREEKPFRPHRPPASDR